MKRFVALLLCFVFSLELVAWAGLGSDDARYIGGTVATVKENTEGKLLMDNEKLAVFEYKGGKLEIPYAQVNSLEYGQKAGRRLGLAVAVSPLFLFSKKRRHFLTIGFLDENGKQQAAVFELGKSVIQPTLQTLETRTGKKIDYEDDNARKSAAGK
jgi:hypothetical protein